MHTQLSLSRSLQHDRTLACIDWVYSVYVRSIPVIIHPRRTLKCFMAVADALLPSFIRSHSDCSRRTHYTHTHELGRSSFILIRACVQHSALSTGTTRQRYGEWHRTCAFDRYKYTHMHTSHSEPRQVLLVLLLPTESPPLSILHTKWTCVCMPCCFCCWQAEDACEDYARTSEMEMAHRGCHLAHSRHCRQCIQYLRHFADKKDARAAAHAHTQREQIYVFHFGRQAINVIVFDLCMSKTSRPTQSLLPLATMIAGECMLWCLRAYCASITTQCVRRCYCRR